MFYILRFLFSGDCSHQICEQQCRDIDNGGYACECHEGYRLDHNGISCSSKSYSLNFPMVAESKCVYKVTKWVIYHGSHDLSSLMSGAWKYVYFCQMHHLFDLWRNCDKKLISSCCELWNVNHVIQFFYDKLISWMSHKSHKHRPG